MQADFKERLAKIHAKSLREWVKTGGWSYMECVEKMVDKHNMNLTMKSAMTTAYDVLVKEEKL